MALSIGIVGLPNVGKSTLFNALTKAQNAECANYPFCTIEPNKAVVPVPDERLNVVAKLIKPQRILHASVDFVDIAGLVKGASKGEGLGNKFLANIREAQAVLHVVRCFEGGGVVHVDGSVDPIRDIETIDTELILADLQIMENKADRLGKMLKGDKKLQPQFEAAQALAAHLGQGEPASTFPDRHSEAAKALFRETGLITAKNVIYCCNVDEEALAEDNEHVKRVRELAARRGAPVVKISAKVEEELVGMSDEEYLELLTSFGVSESGLVQVIRTGYASLGLISFFTAGEKEVRAWTVHRGWKAPQAAGVIHTDFERGFIRAEVMAYEDFVSCGSEAACRAKGLLRVEGKEYEVKDGDIMHFLFNV